MTYMVKNWVSTIWYMLFLILIISSNYSCKDKSDLDQKPAQEEVVIPQDFLTFYKEFHSDESYQLAHVIFPLEGKSKNEKWLKENWIPHKPFTLTEAFEHSFENLNGIIIETLMEKSGQYYVKRRFSKLGKEWNLIYYSQVNKLDGFVPEEEFNDSIQVDIKSIKR